MPAAQLVQPLALAAEYIPTAQFQTMMKWVTAAQPLMISLLRFDIRHMCGTIERLYGIYCTLHQLMGTFKYVVLLNGVEHLNHKKFQDPVKSYFAHRQESN